MLEYLANPWLAGFIAPLLASGLAVFVKWSAQNDRAAKFSKEDIAVGQELTVTAIAALVVAVPGMARHAKDAAAASQDAAIDPNFAAAEVVAATMVAVFALTLGLWLVSTVVRKAGWEDLATGRLRLMRGVIFPLTFGLISLFGSALWIANNVRGWSVE